MEATIINNTEHAVKVRVACNKRKVPLDIDAPHTFGAVSFISAGSSVDTPIVGKCTKDNWYVVSVWSSHTDTGAPDSWYMSGPEPHGKYKNYTITASGDNELTVLIGSNKHSTKILMYIGIAIAVLVALVLIGVGIYFLVRTISKRSVHTHTVTRPAPIVTSTSSSNGPLKISNLS